MDDLKRLERLIAAIVGRGHAIDIRQSEQGQIIVSAGAVEAAAGTIAEGVVELARKLGIEVPPDAA